MSLATAIRKLDKVFSDYVRLRDSDADGYGKCISCPSVIHWKNSNAGHYITRNNKALRYSEMNVNLQCVNCNLHLEGNSVGYRQELLRRYGEPEVLKLEAQLHSSMKRTEFEVRVLIDHYKAEIKKLAKNKNFKICQ